MQNKPALQSQARHPLTRGICASMGNTGNTGIRGNTRNTGEYGRIRGHITYLILAIEKITAERNSYVNELSYVSPDSL